MEGLEDEFIHIKCLEQLLVHGMYVLSRLHITEIMLLLFLSHAVLGKLLCFSEGLFTWQTGIRVLSCKRADTKDAQTLQILDTATESWEGTGYSTPSSVYLETGFLAHQASVA